MAVAASSDRAPRASAAAGRSVRRRIVVAVLHTGDRPASSAIGGLAHDRYEVHPIRVDRSTISRLVALSPDVVVIDLPAENVEPARLAATVHDGIEARVVMVSDEAVDDAQIIRALDAGADDFIVRPSADVLDARLRVVMRSFPVRQVVPSEVRAGDVTMDLNAHAVLLDGVAVRCPPVQYELLLALASAPGSTVTIEELLHTVWGARPGDVHPRRLRIAISTMRRILGTGPRRPKIETVPKVGYRLSLPRPADA